MKSIVLFASAISLVSVASLASQKKSAEVFECNQPKSVVARNQTATEMFESRIVVDSDRTRAFFAQIFTSDSEGSVDIEDEFLTQFDVNAETASRENDAPKLKEYFKPKGIDLDQVYSEVYESIRQPSDVRYPHINSYLGFDTSKDVVKAEVIQSYHSGRTQSDKDGLQTANALSFSCKLVGQTTDYILSAEGRLVLYKKILEFTRQFGFKELTEGTRIGFTGDRSSDLGKVLQKSGPGAAAFMIDTSLLSNSQYASKWPLQHVIVLRYPNRRTLYYFDLKGNYLTYSLAFQPQMG